MVSAPIWKSTCGPLRTARQLHLFRKYLTEAEITFDRCHVMKLIGDAVDEVRRTEVKARPELRGTRYVWTKNEPNLTARQSAVLDTLSSTNLKTARAWAACASPSRTS